MGVSRLSRSVTNVKHQENPQRSPTAVAEDAKDAELVRVAAYAGLRLGELLARRWRDVDFTGMSREIRDICAWRPWTVRSGATDPLRWAFRSAEFEPSKVGQAAA